MSNLIRFKQLADPDKDITFDGPGYYIHNLKDPLLDQDAATKAYVDGVAAGLDLKASVEVATIAALPSYIDDNITGVGHTLTATVNGAFPMIDGHTLLLDERILVKDENPISPFADVNNGIYTLTVVGDAFTPWELTRAIDADGTPSGEVTTGMFVFVNRGTINAGSGWVLVTPGAITVDVTPIAFTQFSDATAYTASNGITLVGNDIRLDIDSLTVGSIVTSDQLAFWDTTATDDRKITIANFLSDLNIVTSGGNGILTQTAADTYANRTITGTTNVISVTDGDGVAGNPTIDIDVNYVGQSSITTLGTITTGTWNASVISPVYGGTGISSYVTGDTLYASATNVLSKLTIGTTGQVLTVVAGIPSWVTPDGDISAVVAGDGMTGGGTSGSVTLNVVAAAVSAIQVNVDDIAVRVDDLTIEIDGANDLTIKAGGITVDLLAAAPPSISGGNTPLSNGTAGQVLTAVGDGTFVWSTTSTERVVSAVSENTSSGSPVKVRTDAFGAFDPDAKSIPMVFINTQYMAIGDGVLGPVYFSTDSGATAVALNALTGVDEDLYFSPALSGWEIDTTDVVVVRFRA